MYVSRLVSSRRLFPSPDLEGGQPQKPALLLYSLGLENERARCCTQQRRADCRYAFAFLGGHHNANGRFALLLPCLLLRSLPYDGMWIAGHGPATVQHETVAFLIENKRMGSLRVL